MRLTPCCALHRWIVLRDAESAAVGEPCLRTCLPECGQAYKELNEVQGGVQAAALPVFLGLSLATSFALTKMAGLASPQQGQKKGFGERKSYRGV